MSKYIYILLISVLVGACGSSIEGKGATGSTPCPNEGEERCTSIVSGQPGQCLPRARLNECPRPTPDTTSCTANQITCPTANGQRPSCKSSTEYKLCNANTAFASCQLRTAECSDPVSTNTCETNQVSCPAEGTRAARCELRSRYKICPAAGGEPERCELNATSCVPAEETNSCEEDPRKILCPAVGGQAETCKANTTHKICEASGGKPRRCELLRTSCTADDTTDNSGNDTTDNSGNESGDDDGKDESTDNGGTVPGSGPVTNPSGTEAREDWDRLPKELCKAPYFLCPGTDVCLFPEEIKDGENDCDNGEDESKDIACPEGMSPCSESGVCIIDNSRDGTLMCDRSFIDCPESYEDERSCPYWDGEEEQNLEDSSFDVPSSYTCQSGKQLTYSQLCGNVSKCTDTREDIAPAVCELMEEFLECQRWSWDEITFFDDEGNISWSSGIDSACKQYLPGSCSEEYGLKMCGNSCLNIDAACQVDDVTGVSDYCDIVLEIPEMINDGEEDCPGGSDEKVQRECPENTYSCGDGACIPINDETICDGEYYDCENKSDEPTGSDAGAEQVCRLVEDSENVIEGENTSEEDSTYPDDVGP